MSHLKKSRVKAKIRTKRTRRVKVQKKQINEKRSSIEKGLGIRKESHQMTKVLSEHPHLTRITVLSQI